MLEGIITCNPYPAVAGQLTNGLDAVITAAPTDIDTLVTAVVDYVASVYYPSASIQVTMELTSVAYNAINSYRSNLVLSGNGIYNYRQAFFIEMLIGRMMTANIAPDSFVMRLVNIQENTGTAGLTVPEQTPIYLAMAVGFAANGYWNAELSKGGSSPWVSYFSTNDGQNYLNTLLWNVGAMNGALAAYGASPSGLIEPTTNFVTTRIASALTGAIVVTSGKLMYNWLPKISTPLFFSSNGIASFGPDFLNEGGAAWAPINPGTGTIKQSPTPKGDPAPTTPDGPTPPSQPGGPNGHNFPSSPFDPNGHPFP